MSLHNPNDRSIYQEEIFTTEPISHGLITVENWEHVIELVGGEVIIEKNRPSPRDKKPRLSVIIKGGKWRFRDNIGSPRNCVALRFDDNAKTRKNLGNLKEFIKEKGK